MFDKVENANQRKTFYLWSTEDNPIQKEPNTLTTPQMVTSL